MNCQTLERWLLKTHDPGRVPAEVRDHLADCARCRQFQRHLLRIEQGVPQVPVPPSSTRERFLQQFLAADPPPLVTRPLLPESPPLWPWRALAAAAAGVLILVAGGLLFHALRPNPSAPEPELLVQRPQLLDSLLERDLRLARARSQRDRVEALADLADDLHGETQLVTADANPADLEALARLYAQVVGEGIVPRARDLAPAERRELLTRVADRLTETAGAADRRAKEVPASASALQVIARAARDGDGELRKLIGEEKP